MRLDAALITMSSAEVLPDVKSHILSKTLQPILSKPDIFIRRVSENTPPKCYSESGDVCPNALNANMARLLYHNLSRYSRSCRNVYYSALSC